MKSNDAPQKQATPFGANGPREPITPTTPSGSNQASYDQGFPPITMTLKSAGGLPPKGQDMNQILFEQSSFNRFFAAGGGYQYDAAFSAAISGYPAGARIPNSTNSGFWLNTIDDNATNPENSTAALTGWVPVSSYGTTSISGLSSSSVTLTTLQASKDSIILSGNLTANINIVVPAWVKRWEVINNCVGNFSVTIKTPSGTGVATSSGTSNNVYGDGTNIVNRPSPGSLIRIQSFTSSATYIPSPGARLARARMVSGGGGGGGCPSTGSNQQSTGGGGQSGGYAEIDFTPSGSYAVNPGAAGIRGAVGGVGGPGGSCVITGVITILGGLGGYAGAAVAPTASIGSVANSYAQPSVSAGNLRLFVPPKAGQPAIILGSGTNQAKGGNGGDSVLGNGGQGGLGGAPGLAGSGYGAGGGGCSQLASNNGDVGGAGSSGYIEIWEYA